MKLDLDCVRDILLALEEITDGATVHKFDEMMALEDGCPLPVDEYPYEAIEYHVRQCDMSGMLIGTTFPTDGGFMVRDLTPKGHEFIANIRSETNWKQVQSGLSKIGNYSLAMAQSIASGVATAAFKSYLGLS